MKKFLFSILCSLSTQLFSYESPDSCNNCFKNWFKGGALSYSGLCLKRGDYKIKNQLYIENVNHFYDDTWLPVKINHRLGITERFDIRFGFLPHTDLTVVLKEQSQFKESISSSRMGDTTLRLAVGLPPYGKVLNLFNYRVVIEQTFPTGHFKNFNPLNRDIEASGFGYYRTGVVIVAELLSNIDKKLLRTRFNLGYGYSPHSCTLTNYNIYGGGNGTRGKLTSVHDVFAIFGLEYTLTQYLALVSDFLYSYSSKSSFEGNKGVSAFGTPAITERPIFENLSMTPGLQINFNYNFGFNFCCWFSAAGKNTPSFQSGLIEIVYRN